jgi:hypothetical protein
VCEAGGCESVPCTCTPEEFCQYVITYGDGSFYEAYIVSDLVNLGGFAVNTSVGAIYNESAGFEEAPVDGILGMDQLSTFFGDLVASSGIPDVFSLCMGSNVRNNSVSANSLGWPACDWRN